MDDRTRSEILQFERSLIEPPTRYQSDWLDGLLAPDFVEFSKSGTVYDKDATIAALIAEPSEAVSRYAIADPNIVQLAETVALIIYRLEPLILPDDGPLTPTLRSSIWRRDADGWRLVFHQGTSIPAG